MAVSVIFDESELVMYYQRDINAVFVRNVEAYICSGSAAVEQYGRSWSLMGEVKCGYFHQYS